MKVRILKNFAGVSFSYSINEIVDLPDKKAKEYIAIGYAEEEKNKNTKVEETTIKPKEAASTRVKKKVVDK
ncbi:hypothetical protein BTR23_07435 [Alkalihalophilus pseudofirmus]|nr:hypothetical protein BTR23_07435 [Alkalihalophilus pseudofirmus]